MQLERTEEVVVTEVVLEMVAQRPFRRMRLQDHPDLKGRGIYSIWFGKLCLYVGKAEISLRQRLAQHWESCHNRRLKSFLNIYRGKITFRHFLEEGSWSPRDFKEYEQKFMDLYQPLTNRRRA